MELSLENKGGYMELYSLLLIPDSCSQYNYAKNCNDVMQKPYAQIKFSFNLFFPCPKISKKKK